MPLALMPELLSAAAADRRALLAMNVIQLEHAEAIVAGAERVGRPVVLQVSENTVAYHGAAAPILAAALAVAQGATVQVCVHLDHATGVDLIREAVGLGVAIGDVRRLRARLLRQRRQHRRGRGLVPRAAR